MLAEDRHVEESDFLAKVPRLMIGHELVLAQLDVVRPHDARLFRHGTFAATLEHHFGLLGKNFFRMLSPVFFCHILRVGRLHRFIHLLLDGDDEFFGIRSEGLLDRSPQVRVKHVSYVVKVDGVHVFLWGFQFHRVEINFMKLILNLVQIDVSRACVFELFLNFIFLQLRFFQYFLVFVAGEAFLTSLLLSFIE